MLNIKKINTFVLSSYIQSFTGKKNGEHVEKKTLREWENILIL